MAQVLAIVDGLGASADSPVSGPSGNPNVTLVLSFQMWPATGGGGLRDSLAVTRLATSTAAQWKSDFIAALKAYATARGDTIAQLIGFVDLAAVTNP